MTDKVISKLYNYQQNCTFSKLELGLCFLSVIFFTLISAAHVATKLEERGGHRVVCTAGPADVRATLTCLVAKLQRFCNTKTQSPPLIKVVLIGTDAFVNSLLRTYVEVFASKPPDWQSHLRLVLVAKPWL